MEQPTTLPAPTDVELAYLAGIIDADGYVTATLSIRRGQTYVGAQIGITGSDTAPHVLAARLFGGNINTHRPTGNPRHKDQHHWQLGGTRAIPVITAVLPYLRIKHTRALLVIELQEAVDEHRLFRSDGGVPWLPVNQDRTPEFVERVHEIRGCGRQLDGRTHDGFPA